MPTHWDLDLLESMLLDYEDKIVVDFLCYGQSMSRYVLPLTNGLAKVNHKGALEFPEAINQYLAVEQSNNTLLGPFLENPFPDRTASSPLNSVPKNDSQECRVILDMSFPQASSVNDGIVKNRYLGAHPHYGTQFFHFHIHFHQKVPVPEVHAPPMGARPPPTGNPGFATAR